MHPLLNSDLKMENHDFFSWPFLRANSIFFSDLLGQFLIKMQTLLLFLKFTRHSAVQTSPPSAREAAKSAIQRETFLKHLEIACFYCQNPTLTQLNSTQLKATLLN